jgi:putative transcriptional regulator
MAISYNKLWRLLIDKDMNKKVLKIAAGISVVSKLGRDEDVTTTISLLK